MFFFLLMSSKEITHTCLLGFQINFNDVISPQCIYIAANCSPPHISSFQNINNRREAILIFINHYHSNLGASHPSNLAITHLKCDHFAWGLIREENVHSATNPSFVSVTSKDTVGMVHDAWKSTRFKLKIYGYLVNKICFFNHKFRVMLTFVNIVQFDEFGWYLGFINHRGDNTK